MSTHSLKEEHELCRVGEKQGQVFRNWLRMAINTLVQQLCRVEEFGLGYLDVFQTGQ